MLSKRVRQLTPSTTLAITAKAKALREEGQDIIGLGAGEPDFNTPEFIIQAAFEAAEAGDTKYTPSGGTVALKDAIIEKTRRDLWMPYERSEVMVASGAKHALSTLFQAILDPGDEVIVPAPYWVSYPEQIKLSDGVPVILETDESSRFKVTRELLEQHITPKTKALVLNSPSNPTGMVYSKEELEMVADVAIKHDLLVISDEIYEKLLYNGATYFDRVLARDARTDGHHQWCLEVPCDDRLADRVCNWTEGDHLCDDELSEPFDVEPDIDCASSIGCCVC